MREQIPSWADAEVLVTRAPLRVGVFPSARPWGHRGRDRRFLAVLPAELADQGPHGGTTLPALSEMGSRGSAEYEGLTLLAGEAEGHAAAHLVGAGDGWMLVLAADAWIALGPSDSKPHAIEIGPHRVEVEPGYGPGYSRTSPEPAR